MHFRLKPQHISMAALFCVLATGCHSSDNKDKHKGHSVAMADDQEPQPQTNLKAYAIINPVEGSETVGVISFMEVEGGVRIIADVAGLTPGLHGFHVHEHGDCGGAGAEHAGGHFDPTHKPHGGPDSPIDQRHVGDLGNLDANEEGIAHYNRVDKVISLRGEYSIIGKTVIVHADPDDLKTQPSGNSGKRIACGVIEAGQK